MTINTVYLTGNLTHDAELRRSADGTARLTFRLAVNQKRKVKNTDEWVDDPVFINCALFGQRAEKLEQWMVKGQKLAIQGRLHYSTYAKDDEKRHEISVVIQELEFCGTGVAKEKTKLISEDVYPKDVLF